MVGLSSIIILSSQKDFFNHQMLVSLLSLLEVSIIIIAVLSIIKTVIRYKKENKHRDQSFMVKV